MIKEKIIFGIDKKEISHFTSIELHQTINNHHTFTIKVPHSVIEKPRAYTMENAQKWLGKKVHIALENKNNFLGIITNIELDFNLDHVGSQIILTGFSKTILLESGVNLHSWEDTTLQDMVREVIKSGANEQLQNEIQPEFTHKINYQTQYTETDFQYIQRLAKQYNEWLFYDGEKLFFGKPKNIKEKERIALTFGQDLYTFKLGVKAKQTQFGAYTYNEESNKLYQAKTQHKVEGLPRMGDQAFDASEKLYNTASLEYGRIPTGDEGFLEIILKKRQEAAMADANYITATSGNNKLKIGSIITINAKEEIEVNSAHRLGLNPYKTNFQLQEVGTYVITEINHKATDIGEYKNSFKALPAFIKTLPEPQIAFPQAQNQQAIVIDNADPKGQGRIRVKMLWQQTKNLRTQWIRVMTPDAGTSGEVPANRGMVFIPEVGDHVMLGFRYNDPNRPFVMGSLFNGTTGKGGQDQNHLKSIFTRGGSTITFNELDNSILIKDPSDNTWFMDGAGNINVTAPNLLTLNATDISVNASNNLTTNVGNIMTFNVVKNAFFNIFQKMQVNTPYLHQLITGLFHTNASKALINSDNEIKLESPEMYVAGQKKLFLHSDEVATVNSKGTLDIKGQDGNKQSNVADSHETVKEEIIANCVVHFRPHTNWIGEFGFDWLRIGDTSHSGDVWYKNIVGEYELPYTDINLQIYSGGKFEAKDWAYKKLKNEYGGVMTVPFLKNSYITPYLTLYKGKTAKLSLEVNIQAPPKKLEFKYDKNLFKLNNKDIAQKTKGKHSLPDFLEITCIKTFNIDQYIEVYADDMIVGKLRVHKNGKDDRKKINVVLAKVKTNVYGTKKGETGKIGAEHPKLERHLKQALITPHIVTDDSVNLSKDTAFIKKFITKSKKINYKGKELHDYMLKNYDLKTKYPDSFIIYVFDLEVPAPGGGLYVGEAYDINCDNALVFKSKKVSTLTHEFLHGLGLYHTFDNNGKFTFEKNKTDNIMDYSTNRYSIFVWQWDLIRKHKLIKSE